MGGGGREALLRFLLLLNLDHLLGGLRVARLCLPKACSVLAAPLEASGSVRSGRLDRVVQLRGRRLLR